MAEYSIVLDHLIRNRTVAESFCMIEEWLRVEGAKVKQYQPPNFLKASHGRAMQLMGWKKDAKKTISFELSQQGSDTYVRVTLTPALGNAMDVRMGEVEARSNWGELMAELWMRFD